jgi:hypothetical protein
MNFLEACNILEIDESCRNPLCPEELKKQYRRKILQYHPDKNQSENAAVMFREIRSAYELLKNAEQSSDDEGDIENYQTHLFSFLKNIFPIDESAMQNKIFKLIVQKLVDCCETKAVDIMEKMDKNLLVKIYGVFANYKDVFHFSGDFLQKVEQVIARKTQKDECVIVNPDLDDLWENNLYKLVDGDDVFLIPLWHHELVYDKNGSDLYVRVIPVLPDNISIDADNNIHVYLKYTLAELWKMDRLEVAVGKRKFTCMREQLFMKSHQTLNIYRQGITQINDKNTLDVSRQGDVIVHVEIE